MSKIYKLKSKNLSNLLITPKELIIHHHHSLDLSLIITRIQIVVINSTVQIYQKRNKSMVVG